MENRKIALVTGGSRGIGRAVCLALAKSGADVAVNYAGKEEAAQQTCRMCEELGARTLAIQADVADNAQVNAMVDQVIAQFGRLDILVCNAGITRDNLLMRMAEQDFDQVIATNLKGVWNCMKAVCRPMMKQRCGRIVNVSSIVGVRGNARCEEWPAIIRAVNTVDAMTAEIEEIPYDVLRRVTKRIITEVPGINRVCYDLTPKPTGTIEWE